MLSLSQSKFGIAAGDEEGIRRVVQAYVEGLSWVLTYYHHGCGSWTWFYPYLYAPLASDLRNLAGCSTEFERGAPFTPLLQLLSVLPPQSGQFLPPPYEQVMTSTGSPLTEFYPADFSVDANGKHNAWECVVHIPFINEEVLVSTVGCIDHAEELTAEERLRNAAGVEHRYPVPLPSVTDDYVSRPLTDSVQGKWRNALHSSGGGADSVAATLGSGKLWRRAQK
jgi:5'-3' exonuclease